MLSCSVETRPPDITKGPAAWWSVTAKTSIRRIRMDARTVMCEGSHTARTTAMRTMDTDTRTQIQTKEEALYRRFVFHPFTQLDQHPSSDAPVIVSGRRSTLTDSRGRTYLDAMAGLWCVNVGYGRPEIAEALR